MKTFKKSFLVFLVFLVTLWPLTRAVVQASGLAHAAPTAQYQVPFSPQRR